MIIIITTTTWRHQHVLTVMEWTHTHTHIRSWTHTHMNTRAWTHMHTHTRTNNSHFIRWSTILSCHSLILVPFSIMLVVIFLYLLNSNRPTMLNLHVNFKYTTRDLVAFNLGSQLMMASAHPTIKCVVKSRKVGSADLPGEKLILWNLSSLVTLEEAITIYEDLSPH